MSQGTTSSSTAASLPSDFSVRASRGAYDVRFTTDLDAALPEVLGENSAVLIDRNVAALHTEALDRLLDATRVIELEATEPQKSYGAIAPVIERLIEMGVKRNSRLVAIGGGVIQDVTSFIASILYRGIDWFFVPTTLLAQGDSCIGSKSSINIGEFKNQLGGFYAPNGILIDPAFLTTLPELELRSGIGEMCHYFLIGGADDFELFAENHAAARTDPGIMLALIGRSLEIKRKYVERDEFDRGERQVFNYGHSFGHALESISGYGIPHGLAVTYGMEMSNMVSERLGLLDGSERQTMDRLLNEIRRGVAIGTVDQDAYERALLRDKKNQGGMLGLILTRGLGDMFKEFVPLDDRFSGLLREYFAAREAEGLCSLQ